LTVVVKDVDNCRYACRQLSTSITTTVERILPLRKKCFILLSYN